MRRKSNGTDWVATHKRAVEGILTPMGIEAPPVISKGSQFYNKDNWTARALMNAFGQYVKYNMSTVLTDEDVAYLCDIANQRQVHDWERLIAIAQTPDLVDVFMGLVLQGGAYHEALHSAYSCRRLIGPVEVKTELNKRLPLLSVEKWKLYIPLILQWGNIIEDIRIERCGCRAYPGLHTKLVALQDFVLKLEKDSKQANAHRTISEGQGKVAVITGAFRDLGLGYQSNLQMQVLQSYRNQDQEAFDMVNTGELRPILDRVIALKPEDDLDHLWLAMDIVLALEGLYEQSQQDQQEGQQGDSQDQGQPQQGEASDMEDGGEGQGQSSDLPPIFKVGDIATLNGKKVRVTWAGVPDSKTGVQPLDVEVV